MKIYQLIASCRKSITLSISEDRDVIDFAIGIAVSRLEWDFHDLNVVTWENGAILPDDEYWSRLSK